MTKLKDGEVVCGACLHPGRVRESDPALIDHDGRMFPCRDLGHFIDALRHAIALDGGVSIAPYLGLGLGYEWMVLEQEREAIRREAVGPCPCGHPRCDDHARDGSCAMDDLGYRWCASCGEHHRPPECIEITIGASEPEPTGPSWAEAIAVLERATNMTIGPTVGWEPQGIRTDAPPGPIEDVAP